MHQLTLEWTEQGHRKSYTLTTAQTTKDPGFVRIGRNPAICDVVVSDASVSRLHAELFFQPHSQQFCIRNLRISNPILVNRIPITEAGHPLEQGSQILLGQVELLVTNITLNAPEETFGGFKGINTEASSPDQNRSLPPEPIPTPFPAEPLDPEPLPSPSPSPISQPAPASPMPPPDIYATPMPAPHPQPAPYVSPVPASDLECPHLSLCDRLRRWLRQLSSRQDAVDCSVFAPPTVSAGDRFLLQVFAHRPTQVTKATALAQEFDPEASRRGFKSLELEIEKNTRLTFHLSIPGIEISEPVQSLIWQQRPTAVQFMVSLPSDYDPGKLLGTVTISQAQVPIGHIAFKLKVLTPQYTTATVAPAMPLGDLAQRYRQAFISYASPDRNEVLKRVQMLNTLKIKFFQDVLNLEPGDRWEQALYRHIDQCDVFLLFWSSSAKQSEWVLKEVHYALKCQGRENLTVPAIIPVIIEGPSPVEPPPELAQLHFNDQIVYFMQPPVHT